MPTRLILLGTAGGPRPNLYRSSPAQAIVVDGAAHVVDCGYGVARQMVLAGLPLPTLRHSYITHHHSDHNADLGNLVLLAWMAGLRDTVTAHGPAPLAEMRDLFLRLNAYDIGIREADEGRVPFAALFHAHEFPAPGLIYEDDSVRVTAALVNHPPVQPALAYRFDTADRSIVISGDTTYCPALVALAGGADVLVHEALYPSAMEAMVARVGNGSRQLTHLLNSHTPIEDVGRVATAAGVKQLVLSHLVPADDPAVTDERWLDGARRHYDGPIVVGRDLLEL